MRVILFIITIFGFLSPSLSYACGGNKPEDLEKASETLFKKIDENRDLIITIEEYLQLIHQFGDQVKADKIKEFYAADIDASATISKEEWNILRPLSSFWTKCGG